MKKIFFISCLLFSTLVTFQSCKKKGCTDSNACNYNPSASKDDGSCKLSQLWYQDEDGDGLGNALVVQSACTQPVGYVSNSSDEDDILVEKKQRAIVVYRGSTTCAPCGAYGDPAKKYMETTYGSDVVILNGQTGTPIAYSNQFGTLFVKEILSYVGLDALPYCFWIGHNTPMKHRGFTNSASYNNNLADNDINTIISKTPEVGIGAFATVSGDVVTVKTKTKFYENISTPRYIGVYLLEDNCMAEQYISNEPNKVTSHENVMRTSAVGSTGVYGLTNIGSSFNTDQLVENTYTIQISPPSFMLNPWNKDNLQIAVVIWEGTNPDQMSNAVLVNVYKK
jgi:hypothetical protein